MTPAPSVQTPLRFERVVLQKVWGGRALERVLGFDLPANVPVGETWEVVDREDANSTVRDGPHAGSTLRALMEASSEAILGAARPARDGRFPLLVKFIDANDHLSVQVHPDDATAARLSGGAEGKTEAWFIVAAEPGAVLYAGLREDVTAEAFAAVADGPGVVELLRRFEVRPGDCLLVPGGTVHAIGKGITLLEVQQNSDTTYRLYDWGRVGLDGKPRETHVEKALRCVAFGAPANGPTRAAFEPAGANLERASLARSDHFEMTRLRATGDVHLDTEGSFRIYAVVGGAGTLLAGDRAPFSLVLGDTLLVPASTGEHAVRPEGGSIELLLLQATT
jgi:mannose-6-phosphate isomerase